MGSGNMVTGKVVRFDEFHGYGFIAPDNGSEDVFVHANDLIEGKSLFRPGLRVAFEVEDGERGPKASAVRIADPRAVTAPVRHSVGTATRPSGGGTEAEDGMCDLLTVPELRLEVTEALLISVPSLTGAQIADTRRAIIELAQTHNWVET
jgi:cold shock protein